MLLLALACQDPFDVRRKDLGPFRIAAMGVQDGTARAVVWSGEGMFHTDTPTLTWTLDGEELGQGFEVAVPGPGQLELEVVNSAGERLAGYIEVAEAPEVPDFSRYAVTVDELDLEVRRSLDESELSGPTPGVRVRLDAPDTLEARWMSAMGQGTLLELEPFAADVVAEEIEFDDGELVSREDAEGGVYHQLVLLLDGSGGNAWTWIDTPLLLDGPFLQHEGRLLPRSETLTGLVSGVVGPEGELTDLGPAVLEDHEATCGPAPFELAWLVEGRCGLDQVEGQRVVFETW
jgi:hypothetical protein